ncbi:flagellar motor protein [Oleiphilus messinensis]|uniref:Flagellar motor protein n=1 Tax=Oleiphilus messinensis TaxID=141451 RepID=A0A1Y0I176_9GAMM|nr:flagellar motor protein MotB [Oleiphilus messinensis]ARU54151.1 flagellar motor protein [Oleiphilus messinensis]
MIRPRRPAQESPGASWIMTFADLMTLLLTFFILLLSFSQIDADKYKMIAQSMSVSFGVSWIQGSPPPIIISEEAVLPPPAEPTEIEAIVPDRPQTTEVKPTSAMEQEVSKANVTVVDPNVETLAENLIQELETEIASNSLSVSYDNRRVIVRFSEDATFSSGSSELKMEMDPIIIRIVEALRRCQGDIIVSGYTDDRPITSQRFRSNWDLSAARAVSVVHQLLEQGTLDPNRIMAAGHADTNPLVVNEDALSRAKNRRVEIKIFNPECEAGTVVW